MLNCDKYKRMHWKTLHKSILIIMQTFIVTRPENQNLTIWLPGSGSGPVTGLVYRILYTEYSSWNMESTRIIYVQKIKYHKIISWPYGRGVMWQKLKNALFFTILDFVEIIST